MQKGGVPVLGYLCAESGSVDWKLERKVTKEGKEFWGRLQETEVGREALWCMRVGKPVMG